MNKNNFPVLLEQHLQTIISRVYDPEYKHPSALLLGSGFQLSAIDIRKDLGNISTRKYFNYEEWVRPYFTFAKNNKGTDTYKQPGKYNNGYPRLCKPTNLLKKLANERNLKIDMIKPTTLYEEWLVSDRKYSEGSEGRLHNPIQNIPKKFRPIFFPGYFDYDISTAAPTILFQKAKAEKWAPYVKYYIENKKEVRNKLALECGTTVDEIKTVLTSLFYKAEIPTEIMLQAWERRHGSDEKYGDVYTAFEKTGPVIMRKLMKNELFIGLVNECENIFGVLSEKIKAKHTEIVDGNYLCTFPSGLKRTMGIVDHFDDKSAVAHYYFGYERLITNIFIKFTKGKDTVYMHDGFYCKEQIDVKKIEEEVKKKLKLTVIIEEDIL